MRKQHQLLARAFVDDAEVLRRLKYCGEWNGSRHYFCRQVFCPKCRYRYGSKQIAYVVDNWRSAANEHCSFVSIVFECAVEPSALGEGFAKARYSLRNVFDKHRSTSAMWRTVELIGWFEVDCVEHEGIMLSPSRRGLLCDLGMGTSKEVTYVLTAHCLVFHPDLSRTELRAGLRRKWRLKGQCDVRAFNSAKGFRSNVEYLVRYSLKRRYYTKIRGVSSGWSSSSVRHYEEWSKSYSRGFQSFRIRIGRKL